MLVLSSAGKESTLFIYDTKPVDICEPFIVYGIIGKLIILYRAAYTGVGIILMFLSLSGSRCDPYANIESATQYSHMGSAIRRPVTFFF